jgi:flagellar biosynthesis protein FliR
MFSVSQLNEIQLIAFGLILLRMSGFVFTAAILNSPSISIPLKILLSLVLTMTMFNTVATNSVLVDLKAMEDSLISLAAKEAIIGISLGFATRIFFFAINMAGEMISVAMGLGQAQMFNPMMGAMGNVMEQFFVALATLLYMGLNGHHFMIEGISDSFQVISLASLNMKAIGYYEVAKYTQEFFIFGIKIAAPVMISMLVVQVGVGILSRAVPQVNVLMTAAPVTILLGFGILFISLPLMLLQINGLLEVSTAELFKFIKMI